MIMGIFRSFLARRSSADSPPMVWAPDAPEPKNPTVETPEEPHEPYADERINPSVPMVPERPAAAVAEEPFEPYPYEAEAYPAELPPDERPNPIAPMEAAPDPTPADPWPEPVPEPSPLADIRLLLTEFETLGANPEFGLLREKLGAAPDGLFGLASTYPRSLLALLTRRFAGTGDRENLTAKVAFGSYFVTDPRNNMTWSSKFRAEQASEAAVLEHEAIRLTELRERLIENLTEGKRLFVYAGPIPDEDMPAIRAAMRSYGENTLLHVVLADTANPARRVEWQGAGLLRGYISRYGHGGPTWDIAVDDWVAICQAAHSLWKTSALP